MGYHPCQTIGDACKTLSIESEISFETMNSAQCEALCEGSRDNDNDEDTTKHCRFWRWEVNETGVNSCAFMNGDQCTNYKYCGQKNCDCGDVGCPGEPGGDPQPPDDMKTCVLGLSFILVRTVFTSTGHAW